MTEEERLQKFVRELLEKHLLEWNQEGYSAGWYSLKQEMPGYTDLQPFVDNVVKLALGMKDEGVLEGFKQAQQPAKAEEGE